ncbi:MAG: 16S rRNA (guanine(966)-N(2))-methyltransferase RsmD [Bacteroidetes bacterium]|nr:16S rRNA (guanine(966)-N(2))-methyltransferase RsmD [Bacteroidota bacterium]
MRIIAGRLRSRRILAPEGEGTRPTSDRVRESLFSMIQARLDLEGISVVDLYAGSGALGFESISRGAERCLFVDKDRRACRVITSNAESLGVDEQVEVRCQDVRSYLRTEEERFDLVLLDPPYADSLVATLPGLIRDLVTPTGLIAMEHGPNVNFEADDGHLLTRDFGRTRITLFEAVSSTD